VNPAPSPNGASEGRRPAGGAALIISAAALWATFGPIARLLYARGYSAIELASVRTWIGVAGAALTALVLKVPLRVRPRDLPFFAAYGVIGFAAFEVLLLAALRYVTVPVAISLLYTAPAWVLLLSRFVFGEPITKTKRAALPLSLAGVILVSGALASRAVLAVSISTTGLVLGLAAGFGYGLYTLFGRVAVRKAHPVASVFWSFLFAALALTVLTEPVGPLLRSVRALPLLLALGVMPTLVPYLLYLKALRTVQPGTAAMLACTEPLFAAILAALVLGEGLTVLQAAGMALIVGAAALLARRRDLYGTS